MIVQRVRAASVTDPYSGLPTGQDWANAEVVELPGYLVGWQSSSENPSVNRDQIANQGTLIRPGGVPEVDVLTADRIRALGYEWTVNGHARPWEYANLLGVGGPTDAGTVWNLTLWEG